MENDKKIAATKKVAELIETLIEEGYHPAQIFALGLFVTNDLDYLLASPPMIRTERQ